MRIPDRSTRRGVLALGVGALVVAALPTRRRRSPAVVRRQAPVMGTLADLVVVHPRREVAEAAASDALGALRFVDRTMTRFDPASDVGRANRLATRDAVLVDPETARVLAASLRVAERTNGAFDPCLARAMALWDVKVRAAPPAPAASRAFAGRRLYRALDVGTYGGRPAVRLTSPDAEIDLGGIAKGYGVDAAVDALRRHGITDGLVNVGGDLYALGRSADGDAWHVGVRSPRSGHGMATTIRVADEAVATSGDYEQGFSFAGRRYHHLLDPATGEPRESETHSVTIVASTCMAADAAATAIFGLAAPRAAALLERLPGRPRIAARIA